MVIDTAADVLEDADVDISGGLSLGCGERAAAIPPIAQDANTLGDGGEEETRNGKVESKGNKDDTPSGEYIASFWVSDDIARPLIGRGKTTANRIYTALLEPTVDLGDTTKAWPLTTMASRIPTARAANQP